MVKGPIEKKKRKYLKSFYGGMNGNNDGSEAGPSNPIVNKVMPIKNFRASKYLGNNNTITTNENNKNLIAEKTLHEKFNEIIKLLDNFKIDYEEKLAKKIRECENALIEENKYIEKINKIRDVIGYRFNIKFIQTNNPTSESSKALFLNNEFERLLSKMDRLKKKYNRDYVSFINKQSISEKLPLLLTPCDHVSLAIRTVIDEPDNQKTDQKLSSLSKEIQTDDLKCSPFEKIDIATEKCDLSSLIESNVSSCIFKQMGIHEIFNTLLITKNIYYDNTCLINAVNSCKSKKYVSNNDLINLNAILSQNCDLKRIIYRDFLYYVLFKVDKVHPLHHDSINFTSIKAFYNKNGIGYDAITCWEEAYNNYLYYPIAQYWEIGDNNNNQNIDEYYQYIQNLINDTNSSFKDDLKDDLKDGDVITKTYNIYRNKGKVMIKKGAYKYCMDMFEEFKKEYPPTNDKMKNMLIDIIINKIYDSIKNSSQLSNVKIYYSDVKIIKNEIKKQCANTIDYENNETTIKLKNTTESDITVTINLPIIEHYRNALQNIAIVINSENINNIPNIGTIFKDLKPLDLIVSGERTYFDSKLSYIKDLYDDLFDNFTGVLNATTLMNNTTNHVEKFIVNNIVELHRKVDDYGSVSSFCPVITEYPINYWEGVNYASDHTPSIELHSDYAPIDHNNIVYCPFCEIFNEKSWNAIAKFLNHEEDNKDKTALWGEIVKLNNQIDDKYAHTFGPNILPYPENFIIFWYKETRYAITFNMDTILNGSKDERGRSYYSFTSNTGFYDNSYNYYISRYKISEHETFIKYPFIPLSSFGISTKYKDSYKIENELYKLGVQPTNILKIFN